MAATPVLTMYELGPLVELNITATITEDGTTVGFVRVVVGKEGCGQKPSTNPHCEVVHRSMNILRLCGKKNIPSGQGG